MIGLFKQFRKGVKEIGILDYFKRNKEPDKVEETDTINKYLKEVEEKVTPEKLLGIATLTGCIDKLTDTVASLPIELYKIDNGEVKPVPHDRRVYLLNDDTGDALNGFELKKALVNDYLLFGNGYAYINRKLNTIQSLHYIKQSDISALEHCDPIFKHNEFNIGGNTYQDYQLIKVLRKTKNGATGTGILTENFDLLKLVYMSAVYEYLLVSSGGNKKGFIKAQNKLSKEAIEDLKAQWNNMYNNNKSNCVVLNNGLDFQESANTSVEMQLNENKKTNSLEICKICGVPEKILNGTCTYEEYQSFIKVSILPLLSMLETSLNVSLLNNIERTSYYFKFNTKELMKADIEKRYKAYGEAVKSGILQIDEIRYEEDLKPLGLEFIKLGLQDVLYNPNTKEIYTPNTNKTANTEHLERGDNENENRGKE